MTLNWNDSPPDITGTVSGTNGGPWVADLSAELASNSLGSAAYTLLVLPVGDPPGYGYALVTNHAGMVTVSGALADGAAFNETRPTTGAGDVPVYASLYGNTGLLLGWLNLEGGSPSGKLTWIKKASHSALYPGGLTNVVNVQGSPWIAPAPHTASIDLAIGQLNISGGGLPAPLTFGVAVNNNNALVKLPGSVTNSFAGSINPKTGLLKITFGNGNKKATTAAVGAVLQNATNAAGYFLGKSETGSVLLQP